MGILGDSTVLSIQGKGRDERTAYIKLSEPIEAALTHDIQSRPEKDPKGPLFTSTSNSSKAAG